MALFVISLFYHGTYTGMISTDNVTDAGILTYCALLELSPADIYIQMKWLQNSIIYLPGSRNKALFLCK